MSHHRSALALAVLSLAACGGESKKPEAAPPAANAAAPAGFTVTAKDFAYELPDTVTGGLVTVKLVNQGPNLHHVQFAKIADGHTYAELAEGLKHMKPTDAPPPWITFIAGPNTPLPGGTSELTTMLPAGNYAVVCLVDAPEHIPHFAHGMIRPLTVKAPTGPAAPEPKADVTVSMTDYAWDVQPALAAGTHTLKISNAAQQPHEFFIVKLNEGKTADDLAKWAADFKGPPPATPLGGTAAMANGTSAWMTLTLDKGNYVLLCFIPDAKDGKPHVAHGMVKPFTIN